MLQEMELNKALKKFASGRKVMAMMPDPDMEGRYQVVPVELLFNDVRLLVDVPAVVNPDFEEAVQGMTNPPPSKARGKTG